MIDFLVVGFGIAGATIAHELEKRNLSFHVVDSNKNQSATLSAGGIINPVTGRKYALQWNIEQLLQQAKTTYQELEEKLQI
ncbi:MAG TPA: FAD-dependent oxidoreductase, partial [Chitinophagales bacterium]|nr:FAD-dependent oxidoreductase [Chitinophagales bacterium]